MVRFGPYRSPSEAASCLGISTKALRLYESRGLIQPERTGSGWRAYGPAAMARAKDVIALRRLGFSLAQVARVLKGDPAGLGAALAAHQATLESQQRALAGTLERLRGLSNAIAKGHAPTAGDLIEVAMPAAGPDLRLDLPWPWGGEALELRDLRPLNYIVGPLGSGKTRFAMAIAQALPGARFLGPERLTRDGPSAETRLGQDPDLRLRVEQSLAWLTEDGATPSRALMELLVELEAEGPAALVVDMVEDGLDQASQQALIAHLRRRASVSRLVFLMTRSSAILDLDEVGPDESILFCPANHSPPMRVLPIAGSRGYEGVATCLATPEVRARSAGIVAIRAPQDQD